MPFDSNGNAQINRTIAVSGQTVQAVQVNVPFDDVQSMLNQVLLRSGIAPLSGNLSAAGYKLTNLANGTSDGDSVNVSQLNAVSASVTNSAPPGAVQAFRRKTVPPGWVLEDGGTIGSASSGATNRANADTLALYTVLWTEFSNTELPIQTSGGAATSRGATAAADFAANKRMPLFDARTRFLRGSDSGLGFDLTLIPGVSQFDAIKEHNHVAVVSGNVAHDHLARGVNPGSGTAVGVVSGSDTGPANAIFPASAPYPTVTIQNTGFAENRPRSSVVLYCVKL